MPDDDPKRARTEATAAALDLPTALPYLRYCTVHCAAPLTSHSHEALIASITIEYRLTSFQPYGCSRYSIYRPTPLEASPQRDHPCTISSARSLSIVSNHTASVLSSSGTCSAHRQIRSTRLSVCPNAFNQLQTRHEQDADRKLQSRRQMRTSHPRIGRSY